MASYTSTPYADVFALATALAQSPLDMAVVVTIQTPVLPEDGERTQFMCAVADIQIRLSGVPPDHEPDPPVPEPTKVLFAKVDDANIRYEPTTDSPSAAQLRAGTPVTVVSNRIFDGINGNTLKWLKVTAPTPGYMAMVALAETAPPVPTEQLWATADVNIRLTPKVAKDNFAGVMRKGQSFTFRKGLRIPGGDYQFAERADNEIGYVADKWLTNIPPTQPIPPVIPPPPVPQPTTHPTQVIGLHIAPFGGIGEAQAVIDHLAVRSQDKRPASGVLLADPGYGVQVEVADVRRVSPATEIVVRVTESDYRHPTAWVGATAAEGRQFVNEIFARRIVAKPTILEANFLQLWNEPLPEVTQAGLIGFNLWQHGVLDRARELKLHLAMPAFSTGFGRLREFGDVSPFYWEMPSTHEIVDRIQLEGHRLLLHAYRSKVKENDRWDDPWELFRHEAIYRTLPADRRPALAIGEYGDERVKHKGDQLFEDNILYAINRLRETPQVKWVALWGVGQTSDQWKEDRIDGLLPLLTRILLR